MSEDRGMCRRSGGDLRDILQGNDAMWHARNGRLLTVVLDMHRFIVLNLCCLNGFVIGLEVVQCMWVRERRVIAATVWRCQLDGLGRLLVFFGFSFLFF